MKNILGTNHSLSNPLLREHQHIMMAELGNDNYLMKSSISVSLSASSLVWFFLKTSFQEESVCGRGKDSLIQN